MDGRDFISDDSGAPTNPKPKIFSMAQSQALLESKRLNISHIQDQSRVVNDENISVTLQRRTQLQAAPRISLTQFLSNPAPLRPSTPLTTSRPLTSSHIHNKRRRGPSSEKGEGSFSWPKSLPKSPSTDMPSPAFTSYDSPESAYIQQNQQRSVAPSPHSSFRPPSLHFLPPASRTAMRPFRESVEPEDSPENRNNVVSNDLLHSELKRYIRTDPILQFDHLPESRSAERKPAP